MTVLRKNAKNAEVYAKNAKESPLRTLRSLCVLRVFFFYRNAGQVGFIWGVAEYLLLTQQLFKEFCGGGGIF
jgi:hypothetical protein